MSDNVHHETEGLLSPWIRDLRLKQVARAVPDGARILDLACGAGFLRNHLPAHCKYFGVDVLTPPQPERFDAYVQTDLSRPAWTDAVRAELPEQPTVLTAIAFLEHLSEPATFLQQCRSLLPDGQGLMLGTTPHPRGRKIHELLASVGICSRHGADDHEDFLGHRELSEAAAQAGGQLIDYGIFLAGLNQRFAIQFDA